MRHVKNPMLTRNDSEYIIMRAERISNFNDSANIVYLEIFKLKKHAIKHLQEKQLNYNKKFDWHECDKKSRYVYYISKRLI